MRRPHFGAWILSLLRHRKLVTTTEATRLLEKFRAGGISRDKVVRAFQAAPFENLGFAQVDMHRALRKGFPEVIFGRAKPPSRSSGLPANCLIASNIF